MRKIELDSLRGAAAFAVLLWHSTASSLHSFLVGAGFQPVDGVWYNVAMYSPLRIFTAGPEAVWLFFVLSGFVLTRSAARTDYRWDAYYPSRLIRLFVPIAGAVVVTAFVFVVLPRTLTAANSPFVSGLPTEYSIPSAVRDLTVFTGATPANVPLWSLQWEVIFSLLLPVYVLAARALPRTSLGASVVLIVSSAWTGSLVTLYLPMFLIGSVLGFHWEAIAERLRSVTTGGVRGNALGLAGIAGSILLITTSYSLNFLVGGLTGPAANLTNNVLTVGKLVAICLLLALALTYPPLRALLRWRPLVALGTISFSLYLTHGPVTAGLAFAMGPGIATTITQVVVSLLVAVLFYFAVEKWAHRFSRKVARAIRARWGEPAQPRFESAAG